MVGDLCPVQADIALAVDNKLLVTLDDPDEHNPEIIRMLVGAGAEIQFVGELRHSLEDVYMQLVASPK